VGHVDREVIKLYTHVLDDASQAAMRQLAERKDAKGGQANDAGTAAGDQKVKNGDKAEDAHETNIGQPGQRPDQSQEEMPDGTDAG
jgi:hypothetical protein